MTTWMSSESNSSASVAAAPRRNSSLTSNGTYLDSKPVSWRAVSSTRVFSQAPAPSSTSVSAFDSSAIEGAYFSRSARSARVG